MRPAVAELAAWLKARDDIAILTHLHPDGDALGSSLALQIALTRLGKRAFVCCQDEAPSFLSMLPLAGRLFRPGEMPFQPRAYLYCDCAAPSRTGEVEKVISPSVEAAALDHHETSDPSLFPAAVIDPQAAAAGELADEVIGALGVGMDQDIALCLYVAVATDTGGFAFDNTTPACLRLAARCVEAGVRQGELNFRLFREKSAARTRLLGAALHAMRLEEDGQIALICLRLSDFEACGADNADTEGVVNYGIDCSGVRVAILAVERPGGIAKFSLRSRGQDNVARMLEPLGGGGHINAAGVTIEKPFDEAVGLVLAAARALLARGMEAQ